MPRPSAGELEQQPTERVGLVFVESRRRLVEQQHARRGAERARQLHERAVPVGSESTLRSATAPIPTCSSSWSATVDGVVALGRPAPAHLERDEHVLARGEAAERLQPLERARDAEARTHVALRARDVGPIEANVPRTSVAGAR